VIGEGTALSCGVTDTTLLDGRGIGWALIGQPVSQLEGRCRIIRDTVVPDAEAIRARQLTVDLGRDTVDVTVEVGALWRIEVRHPAFRTADSLGVGSSLRELLGSAEAHGAEGEGGLFVFRLDHCGLSFHLDHDVSEDQHKEAWSQRDLEMLSPTARVDYVLVVGCKPL
jgi:hypothetical protein